MAPVWLSSHNSNSIAVSHFRRGHGAGMSVIELIALLLVLTACFGWINHRFVRLPDTVGVLVMGLAASVLLVLLELALPQIDLHDDLTQIVRRSTFSKRCWKACWRFCSLPVRSTWT
jgi:hypothetical protein